MNFLQVNNYDTREMENYEESGASGSTVSMEELVKKPNHHDLSHMILGLKSSLGDPLKVKEVITRYATMLRVSDAMKAALRAICAWPVDCLELLVSILSKYEVFETADTDENLMKRSQSLIQEGKKLVMPVKMFNELS